MNTLIKNFLPILAIVVLVAVIAFNAIQSPVINPAPSLVPLPTEVTGTAPPSELPSFIVTPAPSVEATPSIAPSVAPTAIPTMPKTDTNP